MAWLYDDDVVEEKFTTMCRHRGYIMEEERGRSRRPTGIHEWEFWRLLVPHRINLPTSEYLSPPESHLPFTILKPPPPPPVDKIRKKLPH